MKAEESPKDRSEQKIGMYSDEVQQAYQRFMNPQLQKTYNTNPFANSKESFAPNQSN